MARASKLLIYSKDESFWKNATDKIISKRALNISTVGKTPKSNPLR